MRTRSNKWLSLLMAMAVGMVVASCGKDDNSNEPTAATPTDTPSTSEEAIEITATGTVDLGLSVKWAATNHEAAAAQQPGTYYTWNQATALTLGDGWRLPTAAEQSELISKCVWQWTTYKDVAGYAVKGPSGKAIFLPAAGFYEGEELHGKGEYGRFWSATLHTGDTNQADILRFVPNTPSYSMYPEKVYMSHRNITYRQPVRLVKQ